MAYKIEQPVLLGYEDECIIEKHKTLIDFTTNKIGGRPDWCGEINSGSINTKCKLCGWNMPLVCQIYAPLEGTKYHRTLYIFACIQPSCWNTNESWLCLRQQKLCLKDEKTNSGPDIPASSSITFWDEDADNWGDEDDDKIGPLEDLDNGNLVDNTLNNDRKMNQGDTDTDESSISIDETSDPNANSAGSEELGAFAVDFNNKLLIASAEIELGDDSTDIVTIDTPTEPQISSREIFLKANKNNLRNIINPEFISLFISVGEEIIKLNFAGGNRLKNTEHELNLLHQYNQSELGAGDDLYDGNSSKVVDPGVRTDLIGEEYEKDLPTHGDVLAHRFISRLQKNPGQILRYGRCTEPLLLKSLPKSRMSCENCGSEMVFELQLLPSIIPSLKLIDIDSSHPSLDILEFGTVLIYTCIKSCWNSDKDFIKVENVIVQAESM